MSSATCGSRACINIENITQCSKCSVYFCSAHVGTHACHAAKRRDTRTAPPMIDVFVGGRSIEGKKSDGDRLQYSPNHQSANPVHGLPSRAGSGPDVLPGRAGSGHDGLSTFFRDMEDYGGEFFSKGGAGPAMGSPPPFQLMEGRKTMEMFTGNDAIGATFNDLGAGFSVGRISPIARTAQEQKASQTPGVTRFSFPRGSTEAGIDEMVRVGSGGHGMPAGFTGAETPVTPAKPVETPIAHAAAKRGAPETPDPAHAQPSPPPLSFNMQMEGVTDARSQASVQYTSMNAPAWTARPSLSRQHSLKRLESQGAEMRRATALSRMNSAGMGANFQVMEYRQPASFQRRNSGQRPQASVMHQASPPPNGSPPHEQSTRVPPSLQHLNSANQPVRQLRAQQSIAQKRVPISRTHLTVERSPSMGRISSVPNFNPQMSSSYSNSSLQRQTSGTRSVGQATYHPSTEYVHESIWAFIFRRDSIKAQLISLQDVTWNTWYTYLCANYAELSQFAQRDPRIKSPADLKNVFERFDVPSAEYPVLSSVARRLAAQKSGVVSQTSTASVTSTGTATSTTSDEDDYVGPSGILRQGNLPELSVVFGEIGMPPYCFSAANYSAKNYERGCLAMLYHLREYQAAYRQFRASKSRSEVSMSVINAFVVYFFNKYYNRSLKLRKSKKKGGDKNKTGGEQEASGGHLTGRGSSLGSSSVYSFGDFSTPLRWHVPSNDRELWFIREWKDWYVSLVTSVCDDFFMNDLEIVVWSFYLERMAPNWLRPLSADAANALNQLYPDVQSPRPIPKPLGRKPSSVAPEAKVTSSSVFPDDDVVGVERLALHITAYLMKMLWSRDHAMFLPYLNCMHECNFVSQAAAWFKPYKHANYPLAISPIQLNQRWMLFHSFRENRGH